MSNQKPEFGKEYHLWRAGFYLGTATWTDDPNIGPNFLKKLEDGSFDVYKADRWEEVSNG